MTQTDLLGIWNEIEKRGDNYEHDYRRGLDVP